jgi:hypothetical protein
VQKEDVVKRLEYDLRFTGVDMNDAMKRGALEFHTIEGAYLAGGCFEPMAMMDLLIRSTEESVRKGFSRFRSAGDLSRAVEGGDECRQIVGYEKIAEECFPGKPAIGMCPYRIESFRPDVRKSALRLHRQQIVDPKVASVHASLRVCHDPCVTEIVTEKKKVANPKYDDVVESRITATFSARAR